MASDPKTQSKATSPLPGTPLEQPQRVREYELLTILGEGSFATTYLARVGKSDEHVAVKAMQLVKARHRRQIELFEREAEALRALNHPQIPTYFGSAILESKETFTLYLIQEFVAGRSLAQLVDEDGPLSGPEVVDILASALAPLRYLHELTPPLFHRDLKPSNIIRRPDGTCCLIDFGAVREALADPKGAGSSIIGTFGYMAPEQFQARVFPSTDLYSLGATAVYLLTGMSPDRMEARRLKPDIHKYLDADPHLAAILDLLLEPAAEDRYQTAEALMKALDRWYRRHPGKRTSVRAAFVQASAADETEDKEVVVPADAVPPEPAKKPAEKKPTEKTAPEPEKKAAETKAPEPEKKAAETKAAEKKAAEKKAAEKKAAEKKAAEKKAAETKAAEKKAAEPEKKAPAKAKRAKGKGKKGARGKSAAANAEPKLPINKVNLPLWQAFVPGVPGGHLMGMLILAGGVILAAAGYLQQLGVAPIAIGAVLCVYGLSFLFAAARRSAADSARYLDQTDGELVSVELRSSPLGGRDVLLRYRFRHAGKTYDGTQRFADREAARPFLKRQLPGMVHFDETDPRHSALGMPEDAF